MKPSYHDETYRPQRANKNNGSDPPNTAGSFFEQYTKKPASQVTKEPGAGTPIELSNQFENLQQMETH